MSKLEPKANPTNGNNLECGDELIDCLCDLIIDSFLEKRKQKVKDDSPSSGSRNPP